MAAIVPAFRHDARWRLEDAAIRQPDNGVLPDTRRAEQNTPTTRVSRASWRSKKSAPCRLVTGRAASVIRSEYTLSPTSRDPIEQRRRLVGGEHSPDIGAAPCARLPLGMMVAPAPFITRGGQDAGTPY